MENPWKHIADKASKDESSYDVFWIMNANNHLRPYNEKDPY